MWGICEEQSRTLWGVERGIVCKYKRGEGIEAGKCRTNISNRQGGIMRQVALAPFLARQIKKRYALCGIQYLPFRAQQHYSMTLTFWLQLPLQYNMPHRNYMYMPL